MIYGRWGKNRISFPGGRIKRPVPEFHKPAIALKRELLPRPLGPTINKPCSGANSIVKFSTITFS